MKKDGSLSKPVPSVQACLPVPSACVGGLSFATSEASCPEAAHTLLWFSGWQRQTSPVPWGHCPLGIILSPGEHWTQNQLSGGAPVIGPTQKAVGGANSDVCRISHSVYHIFKNYIVTILAKGERRISSSRLTYATKCIWSHSELRGRTLSMKW